MNSIKLISLDLKLSKQERQLANWIDENFKNFAEGKVEEIAKKANVSTATVTRLAKKLNFDNFRDMQLKLNTKYQIINHYYELSQGTTIQATINNIKIYNTYSISQSAEQISTRELRGFIKDFESAKRLLIHGVASSALAANELKVNLQKLGYNVIFNADFQTQLLVFATLTPEDHVLLISKTGATAEINFLAKLCIESKVPFTIITSNDNYKYKEEANNFILFQTHEQTLRVSAVSSKVNQLVIIDILFMEIFKLHKDENQKLIDDGTTLIQRWNHQ